MSDVIDWPKIPEDVTNWVRSVFAEANAKVSETLMSVPNVRETTLDETLVQSLIRSSAPTIFPSGAVARLDVHSIGGLRQHRNWEIADIAIIVYIIKSGKIAARKIGLLQAKRLFPKNGDVDAEDAVGFFYGMNAHLHPEESPTSMVLSKAFKFDDECEYVSLKSGSDQIKAMQEFESQSDQEIFYLFYNPTETPVSIAYPVTEQRRRTTKPSMGCRVVVSSEVHSLMSIDKVGRSVSLGQLRKSMSPMYSSRLEFWVADLLLACKVGRRFESAEERTILPMLERRSGPIGASIAINIELPEEI